MNDMCLRCVLLALGFTVVAYFIFVDERIMNSVSGFSFRANFGKTTSKKLTFEERLDQVGPMNPQFLTVISVYFAFNKSKHGQTYYDVWTKNMALSVSSAPLVIFTDSQSYPTFKELRKNATFRTTFYVYDTVWSLLKELEVKRNRSYLHNYQYRQYELESEKFHTPNMYAVWNLKAYIAKKVADENPYGSAFFIYTDSGAWREKVYPMWPDVSFVKQVAATIHDLPLFGQVGYGVYNFPWDDIIEATWFAGSAEAFALYYEKYYKVHDERLDKDMFIGKEQALMNLVVFGPERSGTNRLLNSSRIHFWEMSECGDRWFLYQKYFAQSDDYTCGKDRLPLLQKPNQLYTVDGFSIP